MSVGGKKKEKETHTHTLQEFSQNVQCRRTMAGFKRERKRYFRKNWHTSAVH